LFWDATNGRLGIGTNSPISILNLVSDNNVIYQQASSANFTGKLYHAFKSGGALGQAMALFGEFNAGTTVGFGFSANSGSDILKIYNNGNLLLQNGGTFTDSGERLQVTGTAYISGSVTFTNSTGMFWNAANSRLGIGTSSPAQKLHVVGNATYRGEFPYFELVPSVWTGGYFYLQSGTDVTGSVAGSYTVFINTQTTRGYSWNQGIGAGSSKMVLTPTTYNLLIGTTTDVASSKLTIDSTTQGFLPPRMTTTQKNAISSPAAGLVVYDTTLNKLCVYTTAWETITSA
jgi:hypothetical protein